MDDNTNKIMADVKKIAPIFIVAGGLLVMAYFWKSFYVQIESYERGIVMQFGHLSSKVLMPGPNFRFPYPIQKIFKVDVVNDRKLYIGFKEALNGERIHNEREALTLTKFGNLVDLEMEVNYYISDPAKYVLKVEDPDVTVKQSAESAMRMIVGRHSIDEVLTESKRFIVEEIFERLQQVLDSYEVGVTVRRVQFVKAVNPSLVIEAFEDVENAKQDSGKAYLDAQRYNNQKVPEARGNAGKQIEDAKGYAESILAKARGDSARFVQLLDKYTKYKKVTRKRLYLETMEEVLPKVKKIIVDKETNTANFLPLGKL
ncbi:MAG: FtsH protease activity modulator HflK [Fibrobacteria bacterium]|nr:FtsH protease activity modulator HflK [Fibrobacteria bacterium]